MTIRQILAFPFRIPFYLSGGVVLTLAFAARWSGKLCGGAIEHVYWPLLQLSRITAGVHRWEPTDVRIGRQPRNDAERARADADENLVKMPCLCGKPTCASQEHPIYVWDPGKRAQIVRMEQRLQQFRDRSSEVRGDGPAAAITSIADLMDERDAAVERADKAEAELRELQVRHRDLEARVGDWRKTSSPLN